MTHVERLVRHAVYAGFRERAQAPSADALARDLGLDRATVVAALRSLADQHCLTLQPGTDAVWMAHPFSAIETRCVVQGPTCRWFANCAWDAFAILALAGDGRFETRSPATGEALAFDVRGGRVHGDGIVHFLVPARDFWKDIVFT